MSTQVPEVKQTDTMNEAKPAATPGTEETAQESPAKKGKKFVGLGNQGNSSRPYTRGNMLHEQLSSDGLHDPYLQT